MEQNYGNRFQNWEAGKVKKWIKEFRNEQEQKGKEPLKEQNINDLAYDCLVHVYDAEIKYGHKLSKKTREKIVKNKLSDIADKVSIEKKHSVKV